MMREHRGFKGAEHSLGPYILTWMGDPPGILLLCMSPEVHTEQGGIASRPLEDSDQVCINICRQSFALELARELRICLWERVIAYRAAEITELLQFLTGKA